MGVAPVGVAVTNSVQFSYKHLPTVLSIQNIGYLRTSLNMNMIWTWCYEYAADLDMSLTVWHWCQTIRMKCYEFLTWLMNNEHVANNYCLVCRLHHFWRYFSALLLFCSCSGQLLLCYWSKSCSFYRYWFSNGWWYRSATLRYFCVTVEIQFATTTGAKVAIF